MSFLITAEGTSTLPTVPAAGSNRIRAGSPQQEAIWSALADGETHVVVEARAGTGKSTTCAEAMHRIGRGPTLTYCAFNKAIAQEFQAKAPANCTAATMHSLGYGAIRNALGDTTIDADKTDKLAEQYFPDKWEDRESRLAAAKLVSLCKSALVDGQDAEEIADLAGAYGVDLGSAGDDVLATVPEILRDSVENTAVIDFDDMIWLPVVLGLSPRPSDVLFIDEAQDLNPAQQAMIHLLCPTGRVVVVGDPRQAIYAFRGADAASMENTGALLRSTGRGLERYPLTVTWRCPASHVRLVNAIVPDLEVAPGAAEGIVESLSEEAALDWLGAGDMALCRTNAPLVSACYRLLRDGKPAAIRGRDVGRGLLTLIAKMRARTVPALIEKLDDYHLAERSKLVKLRHPGPAVAALVDKVECLVALTEGVTTIDDLKSRIQSLFSDESEEEAVLFSSIHRAKGLERNTVTILSPHLLPHPSATTDREKVQESNLAYVAATRSKNRLIFAGYVPSLFS